MRKSFQIKLPLSPSICPVLTQFLQITNPERAVLINMNNIPPKREQCHTIKAEDKYASEETENVVAFLCELEEIKSHCRKSKETLKLSKMRT
jgi:hypothetical protein